MSGHSEQEYLGVMDASYAADRLEKKYLNYRYRVRAQVAVDAFREFHPHAYEPKVLELGAADGLTLLKIREFLGGDGDYLGVEYAEDLLAAAPELPENVRMIQGDVMALPEEIEDNSYDFTTILAVLEHLTRPADCVEEAYRALKPGGIMVATCPNPFWDDLAGKFGMVKDEYHEIEATPELLVKLAVDAGFTNVSFRPFMWVFTGVLPYVGIEMTPEMSLLVDDLVHKLGLLDFSFVNQAVVAQKPL